jgi:hypothetical protein
MVVAVEGSGSPVAVAAVVVAAMDNDCLQKQPAMQALMVA